MKYFYTLITLVMLCLVACKKDALNSENNIDLQFVAAGETKGIEVLFDGAWTITGQDSLPWLTVSVASGSGKDSVKITAAVNDIVIGRTAQLTLASEGKTPVTINITQLPVEDFDITEKLIDLNFRNYCVSTYGRNGRIMARQAAAVKEYMDVKEKNIKTLQGIEYFLKISGLDCSTNQLSSLNISRNTNLGFLWCDENQLTDLDVTKNKRLISLTCNDNKLKSLNIGNNLLLTNVSCSTNLLTSIDVSKNNLLASLICQSNQITQIDVSSCLKLYQLWCDANQLSVLNVQRNILLSDLSCGNNQLTVLDLSKCPELNYFSCSQNNLQNLDLSANKKLERFYPSSNQLTSIDVSACEKLTDFMVFNNKLSTLDVSKNLLLDRLVCDMNELTSLDISANRKLETMYCHRNPNLAKVYVWSGFVPSASFIKDSFTQYVVK